MDKIQAFITIFVYFEAAQADFGGYGRQKLSILPHFCLLQRAYNWQQSKLCISQKKQPKQSTTFKIGSSNPCIKEKGARSEVIQINNNHG